MATKPKPGSSKPRTASSVTSTSSSSSSSSGDSLLKPDEHNLTIGCEFECVLAYRKPKDEQNPSMEQTLELEQTQGRRAAKIVKAALSKEFTMKCAQCGIKFDWKPKLTGSSCTGETDLWRVDFDHATQPADSEKAALGNAVYTDYTLIGLEIRSPKLQYRTTERKELCNYGQHKIGYDREISVVIEHLNASLCKLTADGLQALFAETESKTYDQQLEELKDDGKQRGYLYVNKVSSFHIHIGYPKGPNNQFSVPHVKHLLYAMLTWERHIDLLHAVSRIGGSTLPTADHEPRTNNMMPYYNRSVYNQPMSLGFIHKAHLRRQQKDFPQQTYTKDTWLAYDLDSWMDLLSDTKSIGQQMPLFTVTPKSCVINLDNLYTQGGLPKDMRTIEFRQAIWTLDAKATLSYIDFMAKLVRFCANKTEDEAKKNFDRHSTHRDVHISIFNIFSVLKCKQDTKEHYQTCMSDTSTVIQRLKGLKQQATTLKDNGGKDQPLLCLILQNVEDQLANFSTANISARIRQKLLTGGYGQMSDQDLRSILPSSTDDARAKLRIGSIPPKPPM